MPIWSLSSCVCSCTTLGYVSTAMFVLEEWAPKVALASAGMLWDLQDPVTELKHALATVVRWQQLTYKRMGGISETATAIGSGAKNDTDSTYSAGDDSFVTMVMS